MTDIIKQGTPEWYAARLGKVSASRIADMLATVKSGWGASRHNYLVDLATERLTKTPRDSYKSAEMAAGTDAEPLARAAYEFAYGVTVEECGFIPHPTIADAGASPDGKVVGTKGLVEIKCPILDTHQATLLGGTIPRQYELQRQFQLACTEYDWCDYVSFLDPTRWPEQEFDRRGMRLFVRRTWRNVDKIAEIEREVLIFLKEVRAHYEKLDRQFPSPVPMPEIRPDNVLMGG